MSERLTTSKLTTRLECVGRECGPNAEADLRAHIEALQAEVAAAEARGFARARERAVVLCEREAERQRTSRADLDLSTPAGRAAHTYSEERERTADVLSDDIRAMQDEGAGDGQG